MALNSFMLESMATVSRPKSTRDTLGGQGQAFTVIAANLPCSKQENSVSSINIYGQRVTVNATTLYFDQDPGTEVNDYIDCTDETEGAAVRYLVVGEAQSIGQGRMWSVECTRERGAA